jgi:hypothetical protein
MEPLLRPIRPVFLMADFCLKLFHSVFGPTKLCGQFAIRLAGLLVTCLGITCRLPAFSSGSLGSDRATDFGANGTTASVAPEPRSLIEFTPHLAAKAEANFTT